MVKVHIENDVKMSDEAKSLVEQALLQEKNSISLYDRFMHIYICDRDNRKKIEEGRLFFRNSKIPEWKLKGQTTKDHYKKYAIHNMDKIQITTLLMYSEDDPFVSVKSLGKYLFR